MVASVNTVAILAVILGPAIGALGLFFAWLQGQGERSLRLSLAEAQQQHERQLKRGDRLFDKRGDLYVRLLGFLDRQLMRVERTNPLITIGSPQDPPGPEDEREAAELQAEIGSTDRLKFGRRSSSSPPPYDHSSSNQARSTLRGRREQVRRPSIGRRSRRRDRRCATSRTRHASRSRGRSRTCEARTSSAPVATLGVRSLAVLSGA